MSYVRVFCLLGMLLFAASAYATVFGSVRGVVHDSQHRPVQGASVTLRAKSSDWARSTQSDANGEFQFNPVPIGEYSVTVESPGFAPSTRDLLVAAGTVPVVHVQLQVAGKTENVTVSGVPEAVPTDSVTPTTIITRQDIETTPGADRTNGSQMITDYVPGAYVTHDMLHMRRRPPGRVAN